MCAGSEPPLGAASSALSARTVVVGSQRTACVVLPWPTCSTIGPSPTSATEAGGAAAVPSAPARGRSRSAGVWRSAPPSSAIVQYRFGGSSVCTATTAAASVEPSEAA